MDVGIKSVDIDIVNLSTSPINNPWCRGIQPSKTVFISTENNQPINDCSESPPKDDKSSKILRQIEFYFSDANILKDQFMLKSVKSSKDGWLKLSVLAGFKRLKSLTSDEAEIQEALKSSTQLELSDDGQLIRRRNPLPSWDRSVYSRTLLISAFDTNEVVSVDSITSLFNSVNLPAILVRIIDSGRSVPPDLAKSQSIHGYLGSEICAVVEFETIEIAYKATSFARTIWPKCYARTLSFNKKNSSSSKEKPLEKSNDLRKTKTNQSATPASRPHIVLTSSAYSEGKVILVREPYAPPSEESRGFAKDWRNELKIQRLAISSEEESSEQDSSQASPTHHTPSTPSLMKLDEAIVCCSL